MGYDSTHWRPRPARRTKSRAAMQRCAGETWDKSRRLSRKLSASHQDHRPMLRRARLAAASLLALAARRLRAPRARRRRPVSRARPIRARSQLHVDATDLAHRMFTVREEIPVAAGPAAAVLPAMAAGQPRPARPDRPGRRPALQRRRQVAAVAPRSARHVQLPGRRARRRQHAGRRVRVPVADRSARRAAWW